MDTERQRAVVLLGKLGHALPAVRARNLHSLVFKLEEGLILPDDVVQETTALDALLTVYFPVPVTGALDPLTSSHHAVYRDAAALLGVLVQHTYGYLWLRDRNGLGRLRHAKARLAAGLPPGVATHPLLASVSDVIAALLRATVPDPLPPVPDVDDTVVASAAMAAWTAARATTITTTTTTATTSTHKTTPHPSTAGTPGVKPPPSTPAEAVSEAIAELLAATSDDAVLSAVWRLRRLYDEAGGLLVDTAQELLGAARRVLVPLVLQDERPPVLRAVFGLLHLLCGSGGGAPPDVTRDAVLLVVAEDVLPRCVAVACTPPRLRMDDPREAALTLMLDALQHPAGVSLASADASAAAEVVPPLVAALASAPFEPGDASAPPLVRLCIRALARVARLPWPTPETWWHMEGSMAWVEGTTGVGDATVRAAATALMGSLVANQAWAPAAMGRGAALHATELLRDASSTLDAPHVVASTFLLLHGLHTNDAHLAAAAVAQTNAWDSVVAVLDTATLVESWCPGTVPASEWPLTYVNHVAPAQLTALRLLRSAWFTAADNRPPSPPRAVSPPQAPPVTPPELPPPAVPMSASPPLSPPPSWATWGLKDQLQRVVPVAVGHAATLIADLAAVDEDASARTGLVGGESPPPGSLLEAVLMLAMHTALLGSEHLGDLPHDALARLLRALPHLTGVCASTTVRNAAARVAAVTLPHAAAAAAVPPPWDAASSEPLGALARSLVALYDSPDGDAVVVCAALRVLLDVSVHARCVALQFGVASMVVARLEAACCQCEAARRAAGRRMALGTVALHLRLLGVVALPSAEAATRVDPATVFPVATQAVELGTRYVEAHTDVLAAGLGAVVNLAAISDEHRVWLVRAGLLPAASRLLCAGVAMDASPALASVAEAAAAVVTTAAASPLCAREMLRARLPHYLLAPLRTALYDVKRWSAAGVDGVAAALAALAAVARRTDAQVAIVKDGGVVEVACQVFDVASGAMVHAGAWDRARCAAATLLRNCVHAAPTAAHFTSNVAAMAALVQACLATQGGGDVMVGLATRAAALSALACLVFHREKARAVLGNSEIDDMLRQAYDDLVEDLEAQGCDDWLADLPPVGVFWPAQAR